MLRTNATQNLTLALLLSGLLPLSHTASVNAQDASQDQQQKSSQQNNDSSDAGSQNQSSDSSKNQSSADESDQDQQGSKSKEKENEPLKLSMIKIKHLSDQDLRSLFRVQNINMDGRTDSGCYISFDRDSDTLFIRSKGDDAQNMRDLIEKLDVKGDKMPSKVELNDGRTAHFLSMREARSVTSILRELDLTMVPTKVADRQVFLLKEENPEKNTQIKKVIEHVRENIKKLEEQEKKAGKKGKSGDDGNRQPTDDPSGNERSKKSADSSDDSKSSQNEKASQDQ